MTEDITLIVVAGGAGKRLWPMTTNKALFPFFGMPLFAYTIAEVPPQIRRMVIVTSPANDRAIRAYKFPVEAATVVQKEPRGMAEAILLAREGIAGAPVVIVNVDDLIDPELLSNVIDTAKKNDVFGVIPGWKAPKHGSFGYLAFSAGRVTGIVEKPDAGREPSPYINVVCHYIADGSALLSEIEKTKSTGDDRYEKAITNLMGRHPFAFVPYEGSMAALKHPWNVLDCMDALFETMEKYRGKNVEIKSNVIIEGAVYIEDNVKIFENTKIVGPCYIGRNTIIGNNTIIRASHIGADSVIGFNCDVTRSYIGDNCWLHSNYVGDSVLEGNVSMGGGAKLANLRLDDGEISSVVGGKKIPTGRNKLGAMIASGVRIGVNASIMPGVKIGKNSFIGAGVVLDRDVAEDSFCMAKPGVTITRNLKSAPASRQDFKSKI